MVESTIGSADGAPASDSAAGTVFQRRVEFHASRKEYSLVSVSRGLRIETLNAGSSSQKAAAAAAASQGKRSEGGEFFEHGLDPELSFGITFRKIGAGLANLGNTCFLNSVLQCLTYTEPFAAYLQSGKHKSSCRTAGFCAMCALQNHVMNALQSSGKILSPFHLVKNLRCISRNFSNSRQEDAHEYMVNLLESMHKCCLPSGVPSESPTAYEKSLVHKIFGGRLRSQVKCTQCSYCSNKFDPFLDLSLEIAKADSVQKALAYFTAVEQLDDGQKHYQCQRCKQKVRALKQLTIDKAPYVLTVHLKRFSAFIPGQKIDKKVEFEPTLDLKPFVSNPHEDLKYTLYGVLVHAGWSTHSGHYYCFVRTSTGMWHSLDDNRVLQVSQKTVLAQKAYMLFYVRNRSSITRRPVDVMHKQNRSENASRCQADVKQLLKDASSLQKKVDNLPREVPTLQSGGHVGLKRDSVLQTNKDKLFARQLQQTTLSKDSTKLSGFTKANSQSASPAKDSTVVIQALKNDVSSACVSSRIGEHLSEAWAGVGLSSCVSNPVRCTALNPPSVSCCEKVFTEDGANENVSGATGNVISTTSMRGINATCFLMDEPIQKAAIENVAMDNQSVSHKSNDLLNDQPGPKQGETLDIEKGSATAKEQSSGDCCQTEKESSEATVKEQVHGDQCQTGLKPRNPAKLPLIGAISFGRSQRFHSFLSIQKSKKKKKSKKQFSTSRKMVTYTANENPRINDSGASTSESAGSDSANSVQSPKKRHRSRSHTKGNNIQGMTDARCCKEGSMDLRDADKERSGKNVKFSAFAYSKSCCSLVERLDGRETNASAKSYQNIFLSLLTTKMKETIAQWDDMELPLLEVNGSGDTCNGSIGYVLDEPDEDYDWGKRKKLKKSKNSFGMGSQFLEAANLKAEQKKRASKRRTISANRPFRI